MAHARSRPGFFLFAGLDKKEIRVFFSQSSVTGGRGKTKEVLLSLAG
jgi:hypothetical protein